MDDFEISLPLGTDDKGLERLSDETLEQSGLNVTLRDTLKQYPGCVHWHLKQGRQSGTLELTLWPQEHRVWFSVHRNRSAPWVEAVRERLYSVLQSRLS